MKAICTLICLLLSAVSQAQSYIPFPYGNARWTYLTTYDMYGAHSKGYDQLMLSADEVVMDGNTYHKLYRRGSGESWGSGYPPLIDNIADGPDRDMGGIREADKRVYYKPMAGAPEITLFDFNMGIGDHMPIGLAYDMYMGDIRQSSAAITNIYYANVGNVMRKHYEIDGQSYVVEGLGGEFGLWTYRRELDGDKRSFICANDGYGFIHPGNEPCNYIYSQGTPTAIYSIAASNTIALYPNPCTDKLYIIAPENSTLCIYDMIGNAVLKTETSRAATSIAYLPNGIYIAHITSKTGNLLKRQRLVKQ